MRNSVPEEGDTIGPLVFLSGNIGGVKQMVCFMSAAFSQIIFVNFLDNRTVVRFAQCFLFVRGVKRGGAQSLNIGICSCISIVDRLTASVDTAAGAGHYLNKVIVCFSGFDFL